MEGWVSAEGGVTQARFDSVAACDPGEPGAASLGVSNGAIPDPSSLSLLLLDFSCPDVSKVPVIHFPAALLLPFPPQQSPRVCFDSFRLFGSGWRSG